MFDGHPGDGVGAPPPPPLPPMLEPAVPPVAEPPEPAEPDDPPVAAVPPLPEEPPPPEDPPVPAFAPSSELPQPLANSSVHTTYSPKLLRNVMGFPPSVGLFSKPCAAGSWQEIAAFCRGPTASNRPFRPVANGSFAIIQAGP